MDGIGEREKIENADDAEIGLAPVEIASGRVDEARREPEDIRDDESGQEREAPRKAIGSDVKRHAFLLQRAAAENAEREHQLPGEGIEIPAARLRP